MPPVEARKFAINGEELKREILRMTDWHTDELFGAPETGLQRLIYPYSRFLVDPERFPDDDRELMAAKGMGAVYTRTTDGRVLRADVDDVERDRLLDEYYWPHHRRLTSMVGETLDKSDRCLIIDAHSFPSVPLPCDLDQNLDRPDICIGTDSLHTPDWLAATTTTAFSDMDFTVFVDRPYAGALVPMKHWGRDRRVHSVMVEVNRRLYLDEATGEKTDGFDLTRDAISTCLSRIVRAFAQSDS